MAIDLAEMKRRTKGSEMKEETKPAAPVAVDPTQAMAEIEQQKWHPNVVMMRFKGAKDATLEQITRDDSRREVERVVAADILRNRQIQHEHEQAIKQRQAAREAARAMLEEPEEPKPVSAATGQRRASEGLSENQIFAEQFADIFRRRGFVATARKTERIQGREVVNGWTVNVHDKENEVGVVACWHGRRHFVSYLEISGHADRTQEAAELMGAMLSGYDAGLEVVDRAELAELRDKAWKYEDLQK